MTRRRTGRRGRYPLDLERRTARLLVRRVEMISALLRRRFPTDGTSRTDNALDAAVMLSVLGDLRVLLTTTQAPDPEPLRRVGRQVELFAVADTHRQVELVSNERRRRELLAAIPIEGTAAALVGDWAATTAERMAGLDRFLLDGLQEELVAAAGQGASTKEMERLLRERLGMTRRQAQLVARDQVGSLNSQITRAKQVSLGVTHFRWSSSGDGRVRSRHERLDGQVFSWADGAPGEGVPGEPPLCRCAAIPVLD